MYQSFDPPPSSNWGVPGGFTFIVSEMLRKLEGKTFRVNSPVV